VHTRTGSAEHCLFCEIDDVGRVSGTFLDDPITRWWSERARRLTFVRERKRAVSDDQGFEGYAWDEPNGPSRAYYLAGSYETFGGGGGAKDRQSFGWFATHQVGGRSRGWPGRKERGLVAPSLHLSHLGLVA
jgi:hypothetical protein